MVVDDVSARQGDTPVQESEPEVNDPAQEVMALLSEHVPLTLLADLALPEGPHSEEIITEEGLPEVAWWESEADTSHAADDASDAADTADAAERSEQA